MKLPRFLTDILTDDTGVNFTPDKVGMVTGIVTFHGLAIYDVVVNKVAFLPNAMAFGGGLAAVLAAGGGGMWLASRQKPSAPDAAPQAPAP